MTNTELKTRGSMRSDIFPIVVCFDVGTILSNTASRQFTITGASGDQPISPAPQPPQGPEVPNALAELAR